MDGGDSSSGLHTPLVETPVSRQTFDQCGEIKEMDHSQLLGGAPLAVAGDAAVPVKVGEPQPVGGPAGQVNMTAVGAVGQVIEKRKRGRPPKGLAAPPKPPPPKRNKEEEDVCFICFDGGSLVLCDRKGCPKAYHPACIKRDEAFFRSKAKWNCGWHICSVCQKAAHYMCYTCTYSLCKSCTKDAEYVCVRGNKGFCTTCMRTIMLIENKDTGHSEVVQVDFDDKTSWEYLFKVYWLYLKGNLSLTINELIQAKNPWRGLAMMDYKQQSPGRNHFANGGMMSVSNKSSEVFELNIPKEQPELLNHNTLNIEKMNSDTGQNLVGCKEWASKELLELVAHVRNGDTSVLSQFDVQALLLEYIKRNNLRDPRRKSQIICDLRLKNLFGKPRVGHIEMLKLLEYHFLIKEDDQKNAFIPAGIVGSVGVDQSTDLMVNQSKKRKTRKKAEEKLTQTNLDDYAAIDLHNISLIYLRRSLMENLLGDEEKFHDKVVGSIVRIRVSCNDQKQDIYRLVQVVGTSKAAVPYKLGDKMTHVMLEVLNLNKKETTSIDAISNQEFSQEECRRLRQSIRCGLVKHWTVGEIQTIAIALQAVRLNDVLEAEILRLNHLRDRANEKGHKKELRACVEKLQLLKMPEERQRRLTETPEVHADPKMDPNYESDEDVAGISGQKQEEFLRSKYSSFKKNGSQPISPKSRAKEDVPKRFQRSSERVARGLSGHGKHETQVTVSGSESGWVNQQAVGSGSETSPVTLPTRSSPPGNISDMEKIWHYRDPNGKIQGPFTMVQLRKWSTTGYFPNNMSIWTNNELDDSEQLTDALNGIFHKAYYSLDNISRSQENGPASDNNTLHSFNLDQTFVAPLHQGRGCGSEELKSVFDHENQSLQETAMHQISGVQSNENPSSSQSYLGQSSGRNWRSGPLNLDLNHKDCNSSLVSVTTPTDSTEPHGDIDILDMPSPTPKIANANLEGQAVEKQESGLADPGQGSQKSDLPSPAPKPIDEDLPSPTPKAMDEVLPSTAAKPKNEVLPSPSAMPIDADQREQIDEAKQSPPPEISVPDSGPGWNGTSGPGVGGARLQKMADEWAAYSHTAPKPSAEEWNSNLVSIASVKPPEVRGDCVTPDTNTDQLAHSSRCQPASNISSWQSIVNEPIEFSTLAEESVSDLLAEVDAMESQSGLASPTSAMKCSDEMMDSCRNDCFSSIEELSPTADAGKSDAVSSNAEVQFPPTVTDDPGGVSQADGFHRLKASGGHSATSSEGETKSADTPVNPREAGPDIHPPAAMVATTVARNRGLESMDPGWPGVPGNMNMGWGGSPQGFPNMGWGAGMGAPWGNPSYNLGAYNGSLPWESPRRYNGERFAGPRDWGFQGGDSGFGRGRPMWGRQSHGGGGGYSRPPPKGQRVCKFYESGHCKKGASCDYLHP